MRPRKARGNPGSPPPPSEGGPYPWSETPGPLPRVDGHPARLSERQVPAVPAKRGRRRNQYAYGRGGEWAVRSLLQAKGYHVTRAAGSKGFYDLIAGKMTETWAIQVKNQQPTRQELNKLQDASQDWWVFHAMVYPLHRGSWVSIVFFRGDLYIKRSLPVTLGEIENLVQEA